MNNPRNNGGGRGSGRRPGFQPTKSSVIFNGGSTYEFLIARPKIREKFIENECWNYVGPLPMAPALMAQALGVPAVAAPPGPAVPNAIIEDLFTAPIPVANLDAAQAIIANKRLAIETTYEENEMDLWDLPPGTMSVTELNIAITKNDAERRKEILKVENDLDKVLEGLLAAVVRWDKDKALHEKKVASCLRVYNSVLGPGPLASIREDLANLRFRAAWIHLNEHYALTANGTQNMSQIAGLLNSAVFDPKHKSMHEHIEEMVLIGNEVTVYGGLAIPEELMREYVMVSIEKSNCDEFADDIKYARRHNSTLQELRDMLQITVSRLEINKSINSLKKKRDHDLEEQVRAAVENKMKASKKSKTSAGKTSAGHKCSHCGKPHKDENCWTIAVCDSCKKTGHISRFCPDQAKPEKASSSAKTVSKREMFAASKL